MPGVLVRLGMAAAALCVCAGAHAETITVRGTFAPDAAIPADTELIVIERFEGDLGQDVEFALADALAEVQIRGEPWFDVISPEALANAVVEIELEDGSTTTEPLVADAQLRGSARSESIERDLDPKIVRDCVKRDNERKCIEYKETVYACRELTVRVDPRVVLIGADGRQMYSHASPKIETRRYCTDEYNLPSVLDMANGMVGSIVATIRRDLAPGTYSRSVRIMESRSGLNRADRNAFRDAVRMTDNDPFGACLAFEALEASNPQHLSVLFNIGLCREASSDLDLAIAYYRRALEVDAGHDYPTSGIARVIGRQRGEAYVARRGE